MKEDTLKKQNKIISVIKSIPKGRVASYGQIATIAGIARGHRLVAQVLRDLPENHKLPWFRILRADGHIGMPPGSAGYIKQLNLLREEGVISNNGKIDMQRYQWQVDLDFLLFRPEDL